jgi:valyl-tRNA synthetase
MPFITEELWHRLEGPRKSIALERYPSYEELGHMDPHADQTMAWLQDVVIEIRKSRAANKIDKSQPLNVQLTADGPQFEFLNLSRPAIERLEKVTIVIAKGALSLRLNIPIDRARLLKENIELENVIANSERQLNNEDIIRKMPEKVVETLRSKLAAYQAQLRKNLDALENE